MPRPKGSRVVTCKCGAQIVGMPGKTGTCSQCGRKRKLPSKKK